MELTKDTPKEDVLTLSSECKKCGHCCSFSGCYVLPQETKGIAGALNMDEKELVSKYLEEATLYNTKLYKTHTIKSDLPYGECVFLNGKTCIIHEAKPLHCKVGSCKEHGESALDWFYLNHLVNPNDPESIRQWASRLEHKKTIPGGNLHELVQDKDRLEKILSYEILRKEQDWEEELGLKPLKEEILKANKLAAKEARKILKKKRYSEGTK
ncbi:MAG: YkgJ family cysteine cluster protein [archaeon]